MDPYRLWLSVPVDECAGPGTRPDHYRLLGLAAFEQDATVIEHAADRAGAYVEQFRRGIHAETAERLLQEIREARVCLLDPARCGAYDRALVASGKTPPASRPEVRPESSGFDAYHVWLSVPPAAQPPDLYRLLGVQRFESDAEVIERAAERQILFLRLFQSSKHATQCHKLLNELAKARLILLNPDRRSEYDARLRAGNVVSSPLHSALNRASAAEASARPLMATLQGVGAGSLLESIRSPAQHAVSRQEPTAAPADLERAATAGHSEPSDDEKDVGRVALLATCGIASFAAIVLLAVIFRGDGASEVAGVGDDPGADSNSGVAVEPQPAPIGSVDPVPPAFAPVVVYEESPAQTPSEKTAADAPRPAPESAEAARVPTPPPVAAKPPPDPGATTVKPKPLPFEGFPSAVTLPKLGEESTEPNPRPAAKVLGKLHVEQGDAVTLSLIGGDKAGKPKTLFSLRGDDREGASREWEVALGLIRTDGAASAPLTVRDVVVAALSLKEDGNLEFAWQGIARADSNAANLANCVLELQIGKAVHALALREPIVADALMIDVEKGTPARLEVEIPSLPESKFVRFEIAELGENFGAFVNFVPDSRMVHGLKGSAAVLFGHADSLAVRIDVLKRSNRTTLTATTWFQVGALTNILTKTDFDRASTLAEVSALTFRRALEQAENRSRSAESSALRPLALRAEAAVETFAALSPAVKALEGGKVEWRIVADYGAHRITLAKSAGASDLPVSVLASAAAPN